MGPPVHFRARTQPHYPTLPTYPTPLPYLNRRHPPPPSPPPSYIYSTDRNMAGSESLRISRLHDTTRVHLTRMVDVVWPQKMRGGCFFDVLAVWDAS